MSMRLEVATYTVRAVEWGPETALDGDRLTMNRAELEGLARNPEAFASVTVELVHPGEPVRLLNVIDAVEPLVKVAGQSCAYPGVEGPAITAGGGRTHRLDGVAVVTCGTPPKPPTGAQSTKPAFIDMFGEAAPYCDASETRNVVITATPVPGLSNEDYDSAVRQAAHRVARRLAEATRTQSPDVVEAFELTPAGDLPRVAYIMQLMDQGPLIRTLVYGHPLGEDFIPTLIHPNEVLDGAVVNANHRSCLKWSTRMHVRNPVILELCRRHGRDLALAGVVLTRGSNANHFLKERSAMYAAKLAGMLGAQAAVITMEDTGNSIIDYMQTIRALERSGIRTVGVMHELAGTAGADSPLLDSVEEADALVSSGNVDELFVTGKPERCIGGTIFRYYSGVTAEPYDALRVSAMECFCGLARTAMSGLAAVDY
jgi:sarcosine reductase